MQIFLTSASGYVGAAVATELARRGHRVSALARSSASAVRVAATGAEPVAGALADLDRHLDRVRAADAIVHTAMEYGADGAENAALDRRCTQALLAARKPGAAFVYTSNAYLRGVVDETLVDTPPGDTPGAWRLALEREVCGAGAHAAVLRLGMVYGPGGGGTIADLEAAASAAAPLPYRAGSGASRWSLVHLDDVASLYAAIVEARASGVFHAVDGMPETVARIAALVASLHANTAGEAADPVVRARLDAHTADLMQRDVALTAPRALSIGWKPAQASFEAHIDACRESPR